MILSLWIILLNLNQTIIHPIYGKERRTPYGPIFCLSPVYRYASLVPRHIPTLVEETDWILIRS